MENQIWTYLIAITLLTVTPGMDTMLIIRNTTRGGWKDGAVSSLGICSGLFVHAIISAVGISLILLQSAWAFGALKLAGAGYLVWLGLVTLHRAMDKGKIHTPLTRDNRVHIFSVRRSLVEGFLSNILNPKAIVFYMAFLPQFIDPSGSAIRQSLFLAGLHFAIAMVWQCLLASLVDQAKNLLKRPEVHRVLDGLTGSVFMLFGIRLALDR